MQFDELQYKIDISGSCRDVGQICSPVAQKYIVVSDASNGPLTDGVFGSNSLASPGLRLTADMEQFKQRSCSFSV